MYTFAKTVHKADQVRRYTIEAVDQGWEVREEQGSEVMRRSRYQDWHQVERAHRVFVIKIDGLRADGWQDAG